MPKPPWYINLHAVRMVSPIYEWAFLTRDAKSVAWPSLWISDFGTRHRGHGQSPLSRTAAKRILKINHWALWNIRDTIHVLLRVISWIGEYSGIEPPISTIQALNYKPMYVCLLEVVIKNDFPYMLHKLSTTMCHDGAFLAGRACSQYGILCTIWKLKEVNQ